MDDFNVMWGGKETINHLIAPKLKHPFIVSQMIKTDRVVQHASPCYKL